MLTITVTACNNEKGLRELKEFEKFLSAQYEICCRSRCRNICSEDSYAVGSDDFAVNAYPTAVNDQIKDSYVV
ncbi:MAG: hypothetical protein RR461_00910 [Angelakisella sp.]